MRGTENLCGRLYVTERYERYGIQLSEINTKKGGNPK